MGYLLRDYQVSAVNRLRAELRAGHRRVLLAAPTGSGKTVIACHVIESADAKGNRTLFVAHREELIAQCSAKLDENSIRHGIIKAGYSPDPWQRVQLASVQTYSRRAASLAHDYRLVIIDEAHHAAADTYQALLARQPDPVILGLTATPYRADGRGLRGTFDALLEVSTVEALTNAGWLVPSRVFLGRRLDLRGLHTQGGDYVVEELEAVVNREAIVQHIITSWTRVARGRPTVAFATTVAHSRAIRDAFTAAGVRAEHLDGDTPPDERRDMLRRLESGKTEIVVNCMVLTEGWDCPPCSCIALARPTKSRGLWRQMVGRALRPFPPVKKDCLLLDHANATANHGYITDPDVLTLQDGVKPTKPLRRFKCRNCDTILNSKPRFCPACGIDTATPRQMDFNGQLIGNEVAYYETIEVSPETYRPKPKTLLSPDDARAQFLLRRDLRTAAERGYKRGWALMRHKARTGSWPAATLLAEAQL